MAFTTDLATDLGKFRLQLGDLDATAPLLSDDEANHFLTVHATVDAAVAGAVDALVLRFARLYDVTVDGQSFKRSQFAQMLAKHGASLTQAQGMQVASLFVTRMDAYSDTVSAEDTGALVSTDGYDLDRDHDIPA